MGERHEFYARIEFCFERGQIDAAFGIDIEKAKLDAAARGEHLPRDKIGMVLEAAQQHGIARPHQCAEGMRHEIEGGRAAAREHDLRRRHAEIRSYVASCGGIGVGCGFGQAMHAAFHIGSRCGFERAHRVEHGQRHLRRCRGIEIGKARREDRELAAQRCGHALFPCAAR